ncbi:hypothetical protein [Amycolatopsis plumensis]|uniref:PEP-CTERM protein-sorting domain-containing protein n=1 Tax=Amycolatopsis plumensis TaxID=236508 RepID=A0ABV5U1T7_9PSEU
MPTEVWIGVGGAILIAAAAFARRKANRKWAQVAASGLVLAGWTLVAHFLVKPLVPASVLAGVILGGCTLGIFLAALIGGRSGRSGRSSRADRADPQPTARDDQRPTTDV